MVVVVVVVVTVVTGSITFAFVVYSLITVTADMVACLDFKLFAWCSLISCTRCGAHVVSSKVEHN
jgi:hypothetical protein